MAMAYPTRYPPAAWRPVRNFSRGGIVVPTDGLIPHVQMGNNSLHARFDNPAIELSSHLWLSRDGKWEQYVLLSDKAWAQKEGNSHWISVECAGYDTEDYTVSQLQKLGELYAWGMREFGWEPRVTDSPNIRGIGTHAMGGAAWGAHSCPGGIRAARRKDILNIARAIYVGTTREGTMALGAEDIKALVTGVWDRKPGPDVHPLRQLVTYGHLLAETIPETLSLLAAGITMAHGKTDAEIRAARQDLQKLQQTVAGLVAELQRLQPPSP